MTIYITIAISALLIAANIGIGQFLRRKLAFVAQWSLLSNITASIIIFFSYPARIGDTIRVVDGDNSVEGKIIDITLFQVLIETRKGETVNYPNNLIVQKPLIKSPEERVKPRLNLPKRNP